jgi:transposase-like protein
MNLTELNGKYASDKECRELLKRLRWPNSVECPQCKSKTVSYFLKYKRYECSECLYQFTVTVGTVFQDTHLPLEKWFLTVLLLCESRKGMSANQIKRLLGITYKTAWFLCHRIRSAMKEAEAEKLKGTVEMDETYVGGKHRGKRGRGSENKEIVIGIRQRGGQLRFFQASDVKSGTLAKYIEENIRKEVEVLVTDDFMSYPAAMRKANVGADIHKTVNHSTGEYVAGNIHTNTVENAFSLFKRGIMGTWHKLSAKHLPSYLDEMCFRFNRRNDEDLFIDTLRHMITAPTLPYKKLTKQSEKAA